MVDRLFNREVAVTVGESAVILARRWDELDIKFTVDQTVRGKPNTGVAEIFNLNPDSRRWARTYGRVMQIEAGHTGRTGVIFSGDVRAVTITHKKNGDVITKIECADGDNAYVESTVSVTIGPGRTVRDALLEIVDTMELELLPIPAELSGALSEEYLNGRTMVGQSARYMDQIMDRIGADWSIQDGRLQVIRKGGPTRQVAVVVSPDTTLIGSPTLQTKKKKREIQVVGVKFKMLLEPSLRPGRSVLLQSREFDGPYVAQRVRHIGGNGFEQSFYTEVEATAL